MEKKESSEGIVCSEGKENESSKSKEYNQSKADNQSKDYDNNIAYSDSKKSRVSKNEANSQNKKIKIKVLTGRKESNETSEKKQNRLSTMWRNGRNTIDKIRKDTSNWFLHRIKTEQEKVKTGSKELSLFEILNSVERILYQSKLSSWFMSFIEYIFIIYLLALYTYVLIPAHSVIGFEVFLFLPLLLDTLCLIKKKYIITLLGLLSIIVERIYVLKRYYDYMNMLGSRLIITFWLLVLETILLSYILIKLVVLWYHSQEGINLRYGLANILLSSVKKTEEITSNSEEPIILGESWKELGVQKQFGKEGMTLDEEVIKQIRNNIDSNIVATIEEKNKQES